MPTASPSPTMVVGTTAVLADTMAVDPSATLTTMAARGERLGKLMRQDLTPGIITTVDTMEFLIIMAIGMGSKSP